MVSSSGPLYLVLDAGNTDVKAMIHANFRSATYFPHAVLQMAAADYRHSESAYSRGSIGSSLLFKRGDGECFLVGTDALGDGETKAGASKYTRNQMGVLFEAAAYSLYPYGHSDVRLIVLHPPKITDPDLRALFKSLKGRHTFTVAGSKTPVEYVVNEIIDLDEPVAALNTFLLTEQGKQFEAPGLTMTPGKEFLVLDIGGAISAFISGQILRNGKVHLNHQSAEPIEIGMTHVMKSLQTELLHDFSSHFEGLNSLSPHMLINALVEEKVEIRGESYPCEKQVASAMRPLAAKLQKSYRDDFKNGVDAVGIVVSGGGGAIAFDYVSSKVLKHKFIEKAEADFEKMRFGAVRGASKGLINYLVVKSKESLGV